MTAHEHNAQRALVAASERASHHPDVYSRPLSQNVPERYRVDARRGWARAALGAKDAPLSHREHGPDHV